MVPQSVKPDKTEKEVKMYFRVLAPTKQVTIEASCGDKILYKARKAFVNPGEIEQIRIPAEKLTGLTQGEIVVNVTKEEVKA